MYNMKKLNYMRTSLVTYKKDSSGKELYTPKGVNIDVVDKMNFRDAKKETIASYKQNPQYRAVYGTDLAVSLVDNLIKLFKK